MSAAAHVRVDAVFTAGRLRFLDDFVYRAQLGRMELGDGEEVEVSILRKADAKKFWQLKWYWGFCVKQCCENGQTASEMDAIFRTNCMSPEVRTLSESTYEQMRDFLILVEQYSAEVIGIVITGPDDIRAAAGLAA